MPPLAHSGLHAACNRMCTARKPMGAARIRIACSLQPRACSLQPYTWSQGDAVTFDVGTDSRGRPECTAIGPTGAPAGGGKQAYGRQADAGAG